MSARQPLDARQIRDRLGTDVVGANLTCFDVCDSTNQRAWHAAQAGAPDGAAFLANAQTAGRGRQGRSWLDRPGACLLISVLLRPTFLAPGEASLLTMLAASATAAAVEAAAGLRVELKWPNDVVVGERKLAGILVETSLQGESIESAIVGVGLNVSLDAAAHPEIAGTATSLAGELGRPTDRLALARELLRQLDRRYATLCRGDREAIFADWRSRLATLGRRVAILDATGAQQVVQVEDVRSDGSLVGHLEDGSSVAYHFGEVSLRGPG
jgi:BirA family biotin operon repressor/biotin-[acetyl-CoA-carboxylase] ligase